MKELCYISLLDKKANKILKCYSIWFRMFMNYFTSIRRNFYDFSR